MKGKVFYMLLSLLTTQCVYSQELSELNESQIFYNVDSALAHKADVIQLFLNGNSLSDYPEDLAKCTNLKFLTIGHTELDTFPPFICKLISLESLDMQHMPLRTIPDEISNLVNLKVIAVIFTNVTEIPSSIVKLKNLEQLIFAQSEVISIPSKLGCMKNLTKITITAPENQASKIPEKERKKLEKKLPNCKFRW